MCFFVGMTSHTKTQIEHTLAFCYCNHYYETTTPISNMRSPVVTLKEGMNMTKQNKTKILRDMNLREHQRYIGLQTRLPLYPPSKRPMSILSSPPSGRWCPRHQYTSAHTSPGYWRRPGKPATSGYPSGDPRTGVNVAFVT